MRNRSLYILWAILYGFTAVLGLFPQRPGMIHWICLGLSVVFFLPPALLLHRGNIRDRKRIRRLSLGVLILSCLLLVLSIAGASAGAAVGAVLQVILVLCTAPMICSDLWVLPLFLWACIFIASLKK